MTVRATLRAALDFGRVLDTVADFFERERAPWAVIGAFALQAWRLSRGTLFRGVTLVPGPRDRGVPVPRPEHLAAMKVQAMKNDPQRALRDSDDVRFLLHLPGVDEDEIRGSFERAGLRHRFDETRRRD